MAKVVMDNRKPPLEETEEQDDVKTLVKSFVRILGDELEKIPAELEDSKKFKEKVRERIKNGARRTSGRIV